MRTSRVLVAGAAALLPATLLSPTLFAAPALAAGGVTINEFHYDNSGTDTGEFVEVAGAAGADLTGWSLELVNGANNRVYDTLDLSGTLNADGLASVDAPGIQNGAPDGIALVAPDGSLAEFLSYEGSFRAANGAAEGAWSTDVGVAESGDTAVGESLQLVDGVWTGPIPATRDALNDGSSGGGGEEPVYGCTTDGVVPIHFVQGTSETATCDGKEVRVQGVVTGEKETDDAITGFYLQEENADADGDAASSEGIFVACDNQCLSDVQIGDVLDVQGWVGEDYGLTVVSPGSGDMTKIGTASLPTPVDVTMPATASTRASGTFEHVESMLVSVSTTMAVSEYYQLSRFGELVLTETSRPYQYTHLHTPTDSTAYQSHLAELEKRQLVLADHNNDQNDSTTGPDADEPLPFPSGGLSVTNRFRGGDTITGLTGPMSWNWDTWRIIAQPAAFDYSPEPTNPAPSSAPSVGGDIQVASFNVLNYFTTLDNAGNKCGPSNLECRGANSAAELERQRDKIANAIIEMDADIVGLIEIENNATEAVEHLLADVNGMGTATYGYINTGTIGDDAIKQALIYDTATVTPVGAHAIMDSSVDSRFDDSKNRPALIQTFEAAAGGRVTVAVNHLKSKGSACTGDPDAGHGQGNCNGTRTSAAEALVDHLATDPTGSGSDNFLIMGDLNAYRLEDPIAAITDAGYTNLIEQFQGVGAYSYVFDSQLGYLDHALASPGLAGTGEVTGTAIWNINADTPVEFDYNDGVLDDGEQSYERKSTATDLYDPDAYRSSDHDPVLVGLDLAD